MKNNPVMGIIEKWSDRKITALKFNERFQVDGIPVWYFFEPLLKQEYLPRPFKSLAEIEENVKINKTATWFENLKLRLTSFGLKKGLLINERVKWSIASSKRRETGKKDVLLLGYTNRIVLGKKGEPRPADVCDIADALKRKGAKPLVLICDPLTKNSFRGLLKFQNLLYNYIDPEIIKEAKRLSRELAGDWEKIDEKKKSELFTFDGKSSWRFLKAELNFLFSRELLTTLITYYLTFKKIVESHKIKVICLTALGGFYEALLLGVAYKLDKKVVYSAHGYGGRYFVVRDVFIKNVKFAAWGNEEGGILLRLGVNDKNIFLVGAPAFDETAKYRRKAVRKAKKTAVLLSQSFVEAKDMGEKEYFDYTRKLLTQISKAKSVGKLVIKMHPLERRKHRYESIVKSLGMKNVEITQKPGKAALYSILSASDLLISYGSTTDIEGLMMDKNVILIDGMRKGPVAEMMKKDKYREAVVVIGKNDNVTSTIEKVLTRADLQGELKRKRQRYLANSFFKIDGKSHERVAGLIIRMI